MSASKLESSRFPASKSPDAGRTLVHLSSRQVFFRKNGIEFRSNDAFPVWTEMTVDLETDAAGRLTCNGVVVACSGNRHTGYLIAMVFTGMTPQSQQQLEQFAADGAA